jgi:hypothetical protein
MTTVAATLALITTLSSGQGPTAEHSPRARRDLPPAQTVGASDADAIRQRVKEVRRCSVTDEQGREWPGRIDAFAPDKVVLLMKGGQRHDFPYGEILRIERPRDTLANGALIGFVSGAAYGLVAVVVEENASCEPEGFFSCGDPTATAYVLVPAILGGLGAGIGVGIDALIHRDATLFRRTDSRVMVAPSLGRGVRGLSVSVRW